MSSVQAGPSVEGILFSVLTLLTTLLSLPPFLWHIKHRNLAASSLVFWIILTNFLYFINSVIWPSDNLDGWWRGYGLCDIEIKLQVAATVGIPAAIVCVMRDLARVLDTNRTILQPTPAQRRRQIATDFLLCFGGPIYVIIVHYVVQDIRYYIFAISGCVAPFDDSWPSIVLVQIWSPFFSLVAVYYSVIVIRRIHKYRTEFAAILSASSSGLTKSRFLRLFLMSVILIILGLPAQFYVLYKNTTYTMVPYSWSRVHGSSWWDIVLIPSHGTVLFDHWIQLAVCTTIFAFFGLGQDAMKMYRRWFLTIGFDKLFPSLNPTTPTASASSSYSSRAQMFLKEKFSRGSNYTTSSHTGNGSIVSQQSDHTASLTEKAPPATIVLPAPEPALSAASHPSSRLGRFLEVTRISAPYSNSRALSLFTRSNRADRYA